jgi:hypothetical protein
MPGKVFEKALLSISNYHAKNNRLLIIDKIIIYNHINAMQCNAMQCNVWITPVPEKVCKIFRQI